MLAPTLNETQLQRLNGCTSTVSASSEIYLQYQGYYTTVSLL